MTDYAKQRAEQIAHAARTTGPMPAEFSPFGWKGERSAQEQLAVDFVQTLPPSPVRAHLASLWALYAHEQMLLTRWIDAHQRISKEAAEKEMAERLALFEEHLRRIAMFTMMTEQKAVKILKQHEASKAPRPRREFKKKEQ